MRRREFITLVAAIAAAPSAARAQQSEPMRRIGFLMGLPEAQAQETVAAFREGLARLGLVEGRNIQIDYRWAGIDPEKARLYARELIALSPDVIVASTNQVVSIAMQETQTIPIVFVFIGAPISSGFAETLQRPGRNLTGFANFAAPMGAKWLELLKEIAPKTQRVGFVFHPDVAPHREFLESARQVLPRLGVQLTDLPVRSVEAIEKLVGDFGAGGAEAGIIVAPHALTLGARDLITRLAARHRMAGVYGDHVFARAGGLMSYGINPPDQLRRAGTYVHAILRGAKPAELPVQLPTSYEMIINLSAARTLGLEVPPSLLARADEVIE